LVISGADLTEQPQSGAPAATVTTDAVRMKAATAKGRARPTRKKKRGQG
jgi:hypothetical protein